MMDRNLRIVFMGTPEFAIPCLAFLLEAGYDLAAVVTAPDKPGGRGMKQMLSSAVKQFAIEKSIPVLQPTNLKSSTFINNLAALKADIFVVVAFRMLPEVVWKMPPLGTINLHGSLLPAYRGAAPIQWAIIRGETITGLTTFRLQHEIDTGAIILQQKVAITSTDTAGTLHDRMMHTGAGLMLATIDLIASGQAQPIPQDAARISHAPKIHHEDGKIYWNKKTKDILNQIRGLSPYPGAWTLMDGTETKILRAEQMFMDEKPEPGAMKIHDKKCIVSTADGWIALLEIQMSGKRRMSVSDFLNGYKIKDWSLT